MKKYRNIILVAAAISSFTIISSCKKQLDLQPLASLSEDNAFQTIDDIKAGTYAGYSFYGAYADNMYISALLSDEAKLGANNSGGGALEYRYQFGSDATSGADVVAAWGDYYGVIGQVNRVLPKVATVTATPDQEPLRDYYKAQLLALRGMAFFELLQAYSKNYDASNPLGVPLVLDINPTGQPARNSAGDVMNQIVSDLNDAKSLLPAVTASNFTDTLLNQVNIAAYQARIALYRKDYDAAVTYASEVINSNVKPLADISSFPDIWVGASDAEVLFRRKYTGGGIGSLWSTSAGQILIAPSDKLVSSYSGSDVRLPVYIGTNGTNNYVNKFYGSSLGVGVVDAIVARTAEMYLIRAEAYANKNDIVSGAADLNFLRSHRINGYVDESFASSTALLNAVIEERYKELAFEGFRYFDLKRNSLPVQRQASDVASSEWQTLPVDSKYFVLPIPSDEIKANSNMVQNPGY
ncbi:MAG: RagB/SusD family nutrient uptake outer membrane protein [Bacteroidetes bacterium]|nr:RagB/SusD family nutrient uptake outer membrane protein [Bacteroidota bacterium]